MVKNIPWTNKKLHCKGEPNRFSGQRDPWQQTKKLTTLYNWIVRLYDLLEIAFMDDVILVISPNSGKYILYYLNSYYKNLRFA